MFAGVIARLLGLSPQVLLIVGAIVGGIASIGLAQVYDTLIDDPHVRELATEVANRECTIRTQQAATEAERKARVAQQALNEAAVKAFREKAEARESDLAGKLEAIEQEVTDYERKLAATKRACLLDDADVDWLRK